MDNIEKYALMKFVEAAKHHSRFYVFCRGYCGEYLIRGFLANDTIPDAVLDNNNGLVGKNLLGVPIISPIELNDTNDIYVIISLQDEYNCKAIREQLLSMGVSEENIVQYYQLQPKEFKKLDAKERQIMMRDICKFEFGEEVKEDDTRRTIH